MTTAYTSLLGLALPVTGELSGTWGDTVNNSITSLLDSAIAGTTTLSSDADVTLTTTTGASNTSRQAILLWTAGGTVTRNITAPAQSKIYTVINKSSSTQSIVLRGVGPTTGVTIVKDESAVCAWNGSDFIKISNTSGAGAFTTLSVTGVATFSAGTAALPAITTTGDTNTGIWFPAADTIAFTEGGVESMRIDASGRLAIGSTSVTNGTAFGGGSQVNVAKIASTGYPCFQISTTTGGGSSLQFTNSDTVNGVIGYNAAGGTNEFAINNALSGALTLSTNNTERARIDSSGNLLVGGTNSDPVATNSVGSSLESAGSGKFSRNGNPGVDVNRITDDGELVRFYQAGTQEGNISVSGTTVSYNGGHLARYTQLTTSEKDDNLLKGTVLSNLDEMCVYTNKTTGEPVDNEQLNKTKVSDVEGDVNIAGVFVSWIKDEQNDVEEMNMAMTGDMIIRIAQGTTVARGDLLMSAGDGTAKPQGDDVVRSKTVAKVTSNHVTCTYADGSYCVPCVVMAC